MKPEIKQKWLEALRSGEYPQTRGCLHDEHGFCCLGVLSDLYARKTKDGRWGKLDDKGGMAFEYGEGSREWGLLPPPVQAWAGLDSDDPQVNNYHISVWNDSDELPFTEIANMIERDL